MSRQLIATGTPTTAQRWRLAAGLGLAGLAIVAVFPGLPLHRLTAERVDWRLMPALVAAVLAIAACLLPRPACTLRTGWPAPRTLALALGGLLLLEPLLHLGLMGYAVWRPGGRSADLMLGGLGLADGAGPWWLLATLALAPALGEEWFFRGRLQPWLQGRLGPWAGLSITTLAFAAAHGDPLQALVAIPLGLWLGLIRLRGRLYPCMLVHGLHNALFLLAGGNLLLDQRLQVALVLVGAWLLATTWAWPAPNALDTQRQPMRPVAIALLGASVLLAALLPSQDRLWTQATVALIERPQGDPGLIAARIARMLDRDRLNHRRITALQDGLYPTQADDPRRLPVLALVDPAGLANRLPAPEADSDERPVLLALETLFASSMTLHYPAAEARCAAAARHLCAQDPVSGAIFLRWHPEAVEAWFPVPAASDELAAILAAVPGAQRRPVILGLFIRYGQDLASDVLFRLPAHRIEPGDRALLHRQHRHPEAAIAAFERRDPERARLWRHSQSP